MRLCALTLVGAWSLALLASCAHHSPVRDSSGGKMPLEIQRTRITSYNVCYTKLLRDFYNFPYAFGQLFGMALYARFQQEGPRITSYNVCYTKLLRSLAVEGGNIVSWERRFQVWQD